MQTFDASLRVGVRVGVGDLCSIGSSGAQKKCSSVYPRFPGICLNGGLVLYGGVRNSCSRVGLHITGKLLRAVRGACSLL